MGTGATVDTEDALVACMMFTWSKNTPLFRPPLQVKAEELATQLGKTDFKYSTGWLSYFNKCCDIIFRQVCGASGVVIEEST